MTKDDWSAVIILFVVLWTGGLTSYYIHKTCEEFKQQKEIEKNHSTNDN